MQKCCFSTYVHGWYQDFIPTYIFSILHAFPNHYVKIFLHEKLNDYNKEALNLIDNKNYQIIENYQEKIENYKIPHLAAIRFLLPEEEFDGFDYVYFGDIDFIVYNVFNDNFYETYVKHCEQTQLPFSNEWNYDYRRYRATGLHFIIKAPYFLAMNDIIKSTRNPYGNHFRVQTPCDKNFPMYDEEMLYYMLCFTFDLRKLIGYLRPLHGLHFEVFRRENINCSFAVNKNHSDEKIYISTWKKDIKKINQTLNSKLMKFMENNASQNFKNVIEKTRYVLYGKHFI
jgi:hypothetical protein